MERVPFDPADALSFISSNAGSIGEAALACADLSELLRAGTVITALAFLACDGNSEPYEAVVHLARPHPGQQSVAARLRDLLAGQPVKAARIQDPYSYRAVPQVHGPALVLVGFMGAGKTSSARALAGQLDCQPLDADHELERFLHLHALNRGVLITPFHNMALMAPTTTEADVDRHSEVFGEAVAELLE